MFDFPLSHINVFFILDGKKYEVEKFRIHFNQGVDYKGQPQHEVTGGKITVTLEQGADDNLYQWAKVSTSRKGGQVVFQTDLGISILRVNFTNGYCINLNRGINAYTGSKTTLTISSEELSLNGVELDNAWKKG